MSTLPSLLARMLAIAMCLLATSCPSSLGTFKYYIANFGPFSLTELRLNDSQTGNDVNILNSDVPPNTLRVIRLDSARFGSSLSVLSFRFSDGSAGTVNSRDSLPGFRYEEVNAQTTSGLFNVDDTAKALFQ